MGRRRNGRPLKGLCLALLISLLALMAAVMSCGAAGPAGMIGEHDRPDEASLGGAYVPSGFGEGSLWATDIFTCDDTSVFPVFGSSTSCDTSAEMFLKRLNPRTGEEVAAIPMGDFFANTTEMAFGAGSVWVPSADWSHGLGPADSGGYGRLVASRDRVWFVEGGALTGEGTLARISP